MEYVSIVAIVAALPFQQWHVINWFDAVEVLQYKRFNISKKYPIKVLEVCQIWDQKILFQTPESYQEITLVESIASTIKEIDAAQ